LVSADLLDAQLLARVLPGPIDRVVYLTGADKRSEAAYRRAYVDGLETLLGALASRGDTVERLLYASSTAVYGEREGEWVDEDTPALPADAVSRVLLEGEQRALASTARTTIVRLAGIYGPTRTRLVREVASGRARLEPVPTYTNRIHRDDAASLFERLLDAADPPAIVVGVDDEPAARGEVLGWIAERLGVAPPEVDPSLVGRPHKRCRSKRAAELGFVPRYPSYREGYAPLVLATDLAVEPRVR
jgi:nucleoside-diphosphate-sugar epimerase